MEVSDQIIKVLDEIGKKFGLIVDWTQKNITLYIQDLGQRIVRYEIYTSIAWMGLGLIALIIAGILIRTIIKDKEDDIDDEFKFLMGLVAVILTIIGMLDLIIQTFDIIKAVTLPETIWLDYLKQYLPK